MATDQQRNWAYFKASRRAKISARDRDDICRRAADGEELMVLALEYGLAAGTIRTYTAHLR
ncbi:hypothetical protein ACIA6D_23760 [Streptomyces cacaoi]